MRNAMAMLGCAALAAGAGILSAGCGSSSGARKADADSNLDLAIATGGRGGAMASGGSGIGGAADAGIAGGTTGVGTGGVPGTGGSSRDGGGPDVSRDAPASSGSDATTVDPKQLCEMWQTRATEQDTLDLAQYGFFKASTVLEGTLGDLVVAGSPSYASLSVDRVRAGIARYEGLASAVRIDGPLYEQLGKGARVILGFVQTHPLLDSGAQLPVWEQPQALLVKSNTLPAEVLDFHAWTTPNVAVVRVEETLDGGVRFALVESLRGNLPAAFVMSVSELWPPLGLTVGSSWIGGFSELMTAPTGATPSATLRELRACLKRCGRQGRPTGESYALELEGTWQGNLTPLRLPSPFRRGGGGEVIR
jgi:hypothetical protein